MKKTIAIAFAAFMMTACYEDYVKDYDYTAAYIAYQYDLRTFVVGEKMEFQVGSVLAGTIINDKDRLVDIEFDDELVTGDLREFGILVDDEGNETEPFNAFNGMMGEAPYGDLSQGYVTNEIKALGISALTPLPASHYSVSSDKMTIKKGRHTATITIKAEEEAFLADANTKGPFYAIGYKILTADADTVLRSKSFSVIAVKYENKLYGNYYHGGKTIIKDSNGEIVETKEYYTTIPQAEQRIYTLKTEAPYTLSTNRLGNAEGKLTLVLNEDNTISISADDRTIEQDGEGCRFNNSKLLQDRKIFLNYKYANGDGTTTYVNDTLTFRNRIRDGINEWQDENPKNYE